MLKVFLGVGFLSIGVAVCVPQMTQAQAAGKQPAELARTIPFSAETWNFQPGAVEFLPTAPTIAGITPQGSAMRILNRKGGQVVAKNTDISEGIIDFDILPTDSNFASFFFHRQDALETECFYLRTDWGAGHPDRMEAVQYNPILKGVFCWNLLPYYQGNASFRQDTWNHIRILIFGRQALIYVNSDTRPTLTIPRLEGNTTHGTLAFDGQMTVAHLVVRPVPEIGQAPKAEGRQRSDIGWLSGPEGFDPTDNDPRYLRHWQVTQPDTIPPGIDFGKNLMPGASTAWTPIQAERRGLINLTRPFGGNLPRRYEGGPPRRIVWLKTTLRADKDWNYKMRLGFTNDVWIFLNGKYLYGDKNYYDEPSMKTPRARVSLDNTSFDLPLKAGPNELLVGVGNDFFGWGIVARLDENFGVKIE